MLALTDLGVIGVTESIYLALMTQLQNLQVELEQAGLWQCAQPSDEAMASEQPFCLDTMGFEQWLRFVFVARLAAMIEHQQPLPTVCSVAPMAEEVLPGLGLSQRQVTAVVAAIKSIDELVSHH